MSDSTECSLRVAGLVSRAELDEVLKIISSEGIDAPDAERALRSTDCVYFDQMDYGMAPRRLLETLEEACVSYCWDWCIGQAFSAGRIAYDALTGIKTTQKRHDGAVVLDLREMNDPAKVESAQMAETLPFKLIGLAVHDSQHELLSLLGEHVRLRPWRQARQARATAPG